MYIDFHGTFLYKDLCFPSNYRFLYYSDFLSDWLHGFTNNTDPRLRLIEYSE